MGTSQIWQKPMSKKSSPDESPKRAAGGVSAVVAVLVNGLTRATEPKAVGIAGHHSRYPVERMLVRDEWRSY